MCWPWLAMGHHGCLKVSMIWDDAEMKYSWFYSCSHLCLFWMSNIYTCYTGPMSNTLQLFRVGRWADWDFLVTTFRIKMLFWMFGEFRLTWATSPKPRGGLVQFLKHPIKNRFTTMNIHLFTHGCYQVSDFGWNTSARSSRATVRKLILWCWRSFMKGWTDSQLKFYDGDLKSRWPSSQTTPKIVGNPRTPRNVRQNSHVVNFFFSFCFLFVVPHQWSQVSSSHPSTATLSTLSVPPPPAPEISAPSRSQIGEISVVALGAMPQKKLGYFDLYKWRISDKIDPKHFKLEDEDCNIRWSAQISLLLNHLGSYQSTDTATITCVDWVIMTRLQLTGIHVWLF